MSTFRKTAICLGFTSVLAVTACDAETREVTMRIDHFQQPCDGGNSPGFCLRVLESSDDHVDIERINGFEPRWGYVTDVVVQVTDVGDHEEYDLVEIVSETRVEENTHFEIELSSAFIERVESREFQLLSATIAYCVDPEVCASVGRALVEDRTFAVELSHRAAASGTFLAHAVFERD
jgi:hypothetical protein